jgi:anti-sigma B factor antagonist
MKGARVPLEVRQNGDVLILVPSEARLDAQAAIPFRDDFTREAGAHAGPVALDLAAVRFMDSSGLGAVVAGFKQLGAGRRLVVFNAAPAVKKLFQMTRIDKVLPLVDTEAEAVARAGA